MSITRAQLFNLLLMTLLATMAESKHAFAQEWNGGFSIAYVEFPGGIAQGYASRFCVLPEDKSISIARGGDAISSILISEHTGQFWEINEIGWLTVDAGCYKHQVGRYYTNTIPTSYIYYRVRTIDNTVQLPGIEQGGYENLGRDYLLNRGTHNLGNLRGRFLIDVYGVDDDLSVKINGENVRTVHFNQVNVYEFTQYMKPKDNKVELSLVDRNNGGCWGIAYRVGDAFSWISEDKPANTNCYAPLSKKKKEIYKVVYNFDFEYP